MGCEFSNFLAQSGASICVLHGDLNNSQRDFYIEREPKCNGELCLILGECKPRKDDGVSTAEFLNKIITLSHIKIENYLLENHSEVSNIVVYSLYCNSKNNFELIQLFKSQNYHCSTAKGVILIKASSFI